jgi:hypothetical protein
MALNGAATVWDEGAADERLIDGLRNIDRTLEAIRLDVRGDSALLTARMMEQACVGGELVRRVSQVSQAWERQADQWWLTSARLFSGEK